ncbi:translation initiation factor [Candidatus Woesearchaeota archaeon]|nr:translation initiation factor [Candidatus Woesearchaeota archaeon]
MTEVCPMCGLVKELCVCETIAKESQKIFVYIERKKFNKNYTIVEGIDEKEIDLKELAKKLKSELACGGTIKDGKIELQGEHKQKAKRILVEHGFAPGSVEVR